MREKVRHKEVMTKPKVAIWTQTKWALGRVHDAVVTNMSKDYDFDIYDWLSPEESSLLWNNWRGYDIILSNTVLVSGLLEREKFVTQLTPKLLNKFVSVCHFDKLDDPWHAERINKRYLDGPVFAASHKRALSIIEKEMKVKCYWTPTGVDPKRFPSNPDRTIKTIKNIGFVGCLDWPESGRRAQMFQEIADKANMNPVYIYDRPPEEYNKLYEGIDLLICCSENVGGTAGVIEAPCCGIPSISTPVNAQVKGVKTFETVEEAVDIINELNSNEVLLQDYTLRLGAEIRENCNYEVFCEKYWKPVFEERLRRNN